MNIDDEWLRSHPLPQPASGGDKEERGRVAVIGGSSQTAGAVILSGISALRVGAGKLRLVTVPEAAPALSVAVPEARVFDSMHLRKLCQLRGVAAGAQGVVVGPGMLQGVLTRGVLEVVLRLPVCLVLDALALRLVQPGRLRNRPGPTILTPHASEMAHLLRSSVDEVCRDPLQTAREAAAQCGCVVALKGQVTWVVDPDGRAVANRIGNVGLATSGSGDTLAGAIAGLVARGTDPFEAAAWGVHLHARAGDNLAAKVGPMGYLASELPAEFPRILAAF
jgi:ADP-dependent NAD(P)H-hydrate dehydratase